MSAPSVTETDPARAAMLETAPAPASAPAGGGRTRELPRLDPDAYELLGELARGGMGRISKARDRLGRVVAVKQLLHPSPHAIALFEREARITARLQHPSIVSVIEAGILPNGEPMYVMKLVPGRALRDVLRESLAVTERLGLLPIVIAIADALAYAHREGVIHRDLKPSNVLIGEFGEVVVIDWGLAHDAHGGREPPEAAAALAADVTARAMGTPAYMTPEAARGEPVDERADVYAIGALLYEMLAGAPPYRGEDGVAILAAVRAGPPEPIARRAPGTPADLAAIVERAMARDRDARYPSARELADELRRFATGQLVSAHVYSLRDRAWRWLRRNRAPVAVGGVAAALVIGLVAIGVSRIVRERDVASDRAVSLTLARARLELDRDPAAALATLAALPAESSAWSAARTIAADAIARGVPRHVAVDAPIGGLAFADGRPRALLHRDDAIELGGGGPAGRVAVRAAALALAADGGTFAAIDGGRVRVWRAARGGAPPRLVLDRPGPGVAPVIALAGDGSVLAAAGRDFGVVAWQVGGGSGAGGELLRDEQARGTEHLAVAADATVAFDGLGRWTVVRPGAAPAVRTGTVVGLAAVRGGAIAATADGALRFVEAGGAETVLAGVRATALANSPDGSRVAAAGDDGVVVLDRAGRAVRSIASRHRARLVAIDDRGAVAIGDGTDIWWWDTAAPDRTYAAGPSAPAVAVAAARDLVVSVAEDGSVWAWQGAAGRRLGAHAGAARALAIAPDGRFAVTAGDDRAVRRWPLAADAAPAGVLGMHQGPALAVAISPDGETVASGGVDRLVRLARASGAVASGAGPTGAAPGGAVLGQHAGRVRALAFAPNGRALASIAEDPVAIVWAIPGGAARRLVHDAPVTAIAWADGGALVTGAADGAVRWWPADGGAPRLLGRHRGAVRSVAAAGPRVASAGDDGQVGLGDASGVRMLPGHDDLVRRLAFAPGAAALASAGEDGKVRIWDPISGESRAAAIAPWVADVAFTPDGAAVIAAGADGGLWRIRDGLPHDRRALRAAIAAHLEAVR
jgi:WD40 repeat protein